jgi:iron complex transport system ATP-binding protein
VAQPNDAVSDVVPHAVIDDVIDDVRDAVIEAAGVDFVRAGRFLLRDVSLSVRPGEHWVLIGPNGAGKTTLLRLLGALEHPTAGQVRVLGGVLGKVDMRRLRAAIGHVDPRHPLQWPLSVREVVLSGATNTVGLQQRWRPSAEQSRQADELIGVLGMTPLGEARWTTLSSGERGRALIARALMPDPALLLLDEPATGLDLAAREQLLTGLDALRSGHPRLASVLVTHHLEEIPASTTHAVLLRAGEVFARGPVADVVTSELISGCFDHPVLIGHDAGRWTARAVPGSRHEQRLRD